MKKAAQGLVSILRWLIRGRAKEIRPDPEWAAEVQRGLSFLFVEHGATLVDGTYHPGSFGAKTATIKAGNIILRVSRDVTLPADYIEARIAPLHVPADFKSPVAAWMALALIADGTIPPTPPHKEFGTLEGLSKFLQQNFAKLNWAYSVADYPTIKKKMGEVEAEHWRQWNPQTQEHKGRSPEFS